MATDKFAQNAPSVGGVPVRTLALNVGGGDLTLTEIPSGFWCTTSGNLTVRLRDDTVDITLPFVAGTQYSGRFAVVRASGATAAGAFLFTA